MISKTLQGLAAFLATLLVVAAAQSPSAVPLTSITGASEGVVLTLTSDDTFTLSIGAAGVTQQNDAPVCPGLPASVSTFTFSRQGASGSGAVSPVGAGYANPLLSLQPTPLQGGGVAIFSGAGAGSTLATETMTFTVPAVLTSNSTQFDYAAFQNPGTTIRITLDGPNLAGFIANGAVNDCVPASGSFVVTAGAARPSLIPSPAAVVLAGMMLGLVGGYRLLRRRTEKPAAPSV